VSSAWAIRLRLAGVAALAFGVRVLVVRLTPDYHPKHDDRAYLLHALALAHTHAYPVFHAGHVPVPTAYRAPGFPALLAGVHVVWGDGLAGARAVQVLLGVAIVVLVGVIGLQLWGPRTALAAAALAAVSPALVLFNASLISEPLFTGLLLAAVSCALAARARRAAGTARSRRQAAAWAVAAGAAIGLAALTRPEGLALALAVAACTGSRRAALAVVLAALVCVAPWTVRNAGTMHAFVPISTETGNTLAGTYNSASVADGRWRDPRKYHLYSAARMPNRDNEAAMDHALTHAVIGFVAAHPLAPVRVAARNATRVVGLAPTEFSRLSLGSVSLPVGPAWLLRVGLAITSLLAVAGAMTVAARRAPPGWWAAVAILVVVALLVNAEQRFAVPLQPFLLLLAPLPFTAGR
jgi:4-amino-4-deoxy-L-arabinose transferase-like glycosyltransferase